MAKNWIKNATKNAHGQFKAKAERAGESTKEFANKHSSGDSKTAKQARLALSLMSMHKGGKKENTSHSMGKSMTKKLYGDK